MQHAVVTAHLRRMNLESGNSDETEDFVQYRDT